METMQNCKSPQTAAMIREHYETPEGNADRVAAVRKILRNMGEGPLSASQLASLDQFHLRGLSATRELAELAAIPHGADVLDAGSGLGGPSRFLADAYGCHVTGVDLTPSFVEIAAHLAERTGLSSMVRYQVADLCALPFRDSSFDLVWTQHVVMNIADRAGVYRECRRVLRAGGKFAFFDVYWPDEKPDPVFPVPWSESAEASFLLTKAETIEAFERAGFAQGVWKDVTGQALLAIASGKAVTPAPDGLNVGTVMGPRFGGMLANIQRNLQEGRVRLAMGVYDASSQRR